MIRKILMATALILAACASRAPKPFAVAGAAVPFQLKPHTFESLPNGLTILWIEDGSLPYVALQMMVKTGSAADPVGREGLAHLTASMLEKGTQRRSASRVSADLEQIGSGFSADVTTDSIMLGSSSLSTTRDEVLEQFREIVLTPAFSNAELERHRKNVLASLNRLPDDADAFANHQFPSFLYGATHPYGHSSGGTAKAIAAITAADVKGFYAQHFVPGNSVLAVVGQYDEAWRQGVRQAFAGWPGKPVPARTPPTFPEWKGIESRLIDRGDLNQAQVLIGTKGISRDVPDYMAVRAALKILGEGFGSRLFEEIRVKRGLTYGIGAFFDPREGAGPFGIYTYTRVDKINEIVTETLRTYRDFVTKGVTDAEVELTKAQMNAQFVRMFETAESLATQLLILNRYAISEEYLTQHQVNLSRLTTAAVNEAIHHHFSPDDLRILIYAPAPAAEPTLKALGPLEIKGYRSL